MEVLHRLAIDRPVRSVGALVRTASFYIMTDCNWMNVMRRVTWPRLRRRRVKKEVEKLREKLRYHEYRYYVLDDPEISDAAYDRLMKQLKEIGSGASGTGHAGFADGARGGAPREGFQTVRHTRPMLSLDNAFSFDALARFRPPRARGNWPRKNRVHRGAQVRRAEHFAALRRWRAGARSDARRWNDR